MSFIRLWLVRGRHLAWRERRLLGLSVLLLAAGGGFLLLSQSLHVALARQSAQLAVQQTRAALLSAMLREVRQLRQRPPVSVISAAQWPVLVRQLALEQQFSLEGWLIEVRDGGLHLSGGAEFDRSLVFFALLDARYQFSLRQLQLQPAGPPGLVRIDARLSRGGKGE